MYIHHIFWILGKSFVTVLDGMVCKEPIQLNLIKYVNHTPSLLPLIIVSIPVLYIVTLSLITERPHPLH